MMPQSQPIDVMTNRHTMNDNTHRFTIYEQRKLTWWQHRTSLEKSLLVVFLLSMFVACFLIIFMVLLYSRYGFALNYAQPLSKLFNEINKIDKSIIMDHLRNSQLCYTPGCILTASNVLQSISTEVDPCDDFYEFSCAKWIKRMNIPEDAPHATNFDELTTQLMRNGLYVLENDVPLMQNDSTFGILHLFWNRCNDKAKVEQDADREFRSFLSKTIGNPFSSNASDFDAPLDLVSFYEHVWNQGYPMNQLFGVQFPLRYYNTTQNTLMLRPPPFSIHMNYLVSSGHSAKMHQENLLTFIAKTLRLLNQEESAAEADARDILEFERRLAFLSESAEGNYQSTESIYDLIERTTLGELMVRSPSIPWKKLVNILLPQTDAFTENSTILLFKPEYIYGLALLLKSTPARTIRKYLIWRLCKSLMWLLDSRWTQLAEWNREVTYGTTEKPDRLNFCYEMIHSQLNTQLTALYLRRYQNKKKRERVSQLISLVHQQLLDTVRKQVWLDETSQQAALRRVAQMRMLVGYPSQLLDTNLLNRHFSQPNLNRNMTFFSLMLHTTVMSRRLIAYQLRTELRKQDWINFSDIFSVNAYYNRFENVVFVPLGIFGSQWFMEDRPSYANLASIGFVAGHEMMHSLEYPCNGKKYDPRSRWCSNQVLHRLNTKSACFREFYGRLRQIDGLPPVGDRTLGENIADFGGMRLAWKALQSSATVERQRLLPGLQNYTANQMFFITYAMNWCRKVRPRSLRISIELDNHSMFRNRVIGVLSNSREFAKAFQCDRDSPMNPTKKCSLW